MKTKYNICILLIILLFLLILYILLENKTIENLTYNQSERQKRRRKRRRRKRRKKEEEAAAQQQQQALEFSSRFQPTDEDTSGVRNEDFLDDDNILNCVYDQSGDCENLKSYSPYTMLDFSSNDYDKHVDVSNDIQYFNNTTAILGNHFPYERVPKQFL